MVKSSSDKSTVLSGHTSRADFEAKYLELKKLGQGGYGSVYAGHRRSDDLPVAIKHIPNLAVRCQKVMLNGRACRIHKEVLLMHKAAGEPVTVGKSAAVSILDWYDLDQEVLLVMERPVPSMELLRFMNENCGPMAEDVAKVIMKQLVDAAIDIQAKGVFHRDIKAENILIEFSSDGLRVRLIDFGCGCIWKKNIYSQFTGTLAYVPPEFQINWQYMAGPTTVWQLAPLLFEMLDGFRRFHTTGFLRNELRISSVWSKDCQDFLGKCLALEPEDRATLEEMQQHPSTEELKPVRVPGWARSRRSTDTVWGFTNPALDHVTMEIASVQLNSSITVDPWR
ncbi:serine/threonine-protein kinase pim-1-like [Hippoglossus hippoglossus]|uniref:serine/threonine-protein kinase pim-1-like n=1 Tax=Hippoglossus hippoglossus TaxID=8267 RepID=UPI00148E6864|nr:serine/threonine-protein kinase pim-1-like [Hippoglossus hippoglossus]